MNRLGTRLLTLGAFVIGLTACGGGGSSPPPLPTVTLSASISTITLGDTVLLNWTSANATSCSASGAWSGSLETSGIRSVTVTNFGNVVYSVVCSGAGGSATANVTITSNAKPPTAPEITASMGVTAIGVDVVYTAKATDPASLPLTYSWDFGDGTTANGASVTKSFKVAGSYSIRATATNSAGKASPSSDIYSQQVQSQPLSPTGTYGGEIIVSPSGDFIIDGSNGVPSRVYFGKLTINGNRFTSTATLLCDAGQLSTVNVSGFFNQGGTTYYKGVSMGDYSKTIQFTASPVGAPCTPDSSNTKKEFFGSEILDFKGSDAGTLISGTWTNKGTSNTQPIISLKVSAPNSLNESIFVWYKDKYNGACRDLGNRIDKATGKILDSFFAICGEFAGVLFECAYWGGLRFDTTSNTGFEIFEPTLDKIPEGCSKSNLFGKGFAGIDKTDSRAYFRLTRVSVTPDQKGNLLTLKIIR